ncbi:MAG: TonB-dependent receptor, partial [Pseudomonadales bacterium]|nr:TonB-dependent receptor [Pseudomonadales bacterium]
RVEIAKGPQSVVHGLNSTAGAISIVTNRSRGGDAWFADIMIDSELEYGGEGITAVVGGGIGEQLGVRLAAKVTDRDGYYENTFTGEDEGDTEDELFRFSAVWTPTDDLEIGLKYESAVREVDGNVGEIFGLAGGTFAEPNDNRLNYERSSNGCQADRSGFPSQMAFGGLNPDVCPMQSTDLETTVVNLDWAIEGATVTAMLGHSEFEFDFTVDLDTTADAFLDASIKEDFEIDAFEIRLTSDKGNTIDYMVGAYYHDWQNFNDQPSQYGPGTLGGLLSAGGPLGADVLIQTSNIIDQTSELFSVFGQVTFNASDVLSITAGLRYTDEEKDSDYNTQCGLGFLATGTFVEQPLPGPLALCSTNPQTVGLNVDRSSDNLLPELSVQWDVSDSAMVYAKFGQSAKGGGFTTSQRNPPVTWTPNDQEYDDEKATGIEAGLKSRWMDNRLEFNAAIYRTEFDDLQVNTFTPVGAVIVQNVTNAATAISTGLELEARFAASENLELGGSWAFQNAEYDSFRNGTCSVASGLASPCDLSGEQLNLAPDWSGMLYADLSIPLGDAVNFVANLTVSMSDGYFTDGALEPIGEQDSWTKVDARIGIEAADARWSVALVGRNLTNERVLSQSQPFFNAVFQSTFLGYLEAPRTAMLQARYRFGG